MEDRILSISLEGRLDAFHSEKLSERLSANLTDAILCLAVDMSGADYLSSAGLRVLLSALKTVKARGGTVVLCGLQRYCREVLDMTGFKDAFVIMNALSEGEDYCRKLVRDAENAAQWDTLEKVAVSGGTLRLVPGTGSPGAVEVLGSAGKLSRCQIAIGDLKPKAFVPEERVVGVGGLGPDAAACYPSLGGLVSVGDMLAWLPSDGHDKADFLLHTQGKTALSYHLACALSCRAECSFMANFESDDLIGGVSLFDLIAALFGVAKTRGEGYHGALMVTMLARLTEVYGKSFRTAPIQPHCPANGKLIAHPSNADQFLKTDEASRYPDATALIVGVALDLTDDLSDFNEETLHRAFPLNLGEIVGRTQMFHNFAVLLEPQPWPEKPLDLDGEIKKTARDGIFLDARALRGNTRIAKAMIGAVNVSDFVAAPETASPDAPHGHSVAARKALSAYLKR